MILRGNEDLRVVKTIEGIKEAFERLICEKDYGKITVKELCDKARINKKTFYHYYETLDALLEEMQMELSAGFLERIKGLKLPEDLDKVNREFFLYSADQGLSYEKITCSVTYRSIRDDMIAKVNDAGWRDSKQYQKLSDFEKRLLMDFINNSTLSAYRAWIENGKTMPLEEVIEINNRIQLGGVKEFFRH
jgi:Transcriptional regulator